jgi:8-oxo-dGTP pyrophosphatase MutT (NUDIX family)
MKGTAVAGNQWAPWLVKDAGYNRRTLPKRGWNHKRDCSMNRIMQACPHRSPSPVPAPDLPLRLQLAHYRQRFPQESATVDQFLALLDEAGNPFARQQLHAHFTAGCWLVSADGERILMTHHRKLQRWLQLGGHADGDTDMAQVALMEAQEESGLSGLQLEGQAIFDLDRHWIPESGDVPGHWHYDVRYVIRAGASEDVVVSEESLDLAWRPIAAMVADPDQSMARMARKWLQAEP